MTRVLLTFTGFHDPYSKGLIGDDDQPGPVLSLLSAQAFDRVVLFSTPRTASLTGDSRNEIRRLHSAIDVEVRDVPIDDPTDYSALLKHLRRHLHELVQLYSGAAFSIAVASGTPQMHAVWVLLAASGEIPASVLHIRPPRFVTADRPLVSTVDLSAEDFPTVRARIAATEYASETTPDLGVAVRQLGIVGDHPAMESVLQTAAALAPSNVPVFIRGETGTGKELIARLVHRLSGRPTDRFVAVNCAAIPADLVESTLFGHKKGAFTGATGDQLGKFDVANSGTLFLDELGDLPLPAQAKLLRVLQDGLLEPVGAAKPHRVDVRIVAATNQDVRRSITKGTFREDLYYRLNVGEITLPPLRERRSDIPKLAVDVLDRVNATLRKPRRLSPAALSRLQGHAWPGNVRDLANVIERSVRLCRTELVDADDIVISDPVTHADPLAALPDPEPGFLLEDYLRRARKQLILRAIDMAGGNQSEAARLLGVTPQAVSKFMKHEAYNRG